VRTLVDRQELAPMAADDAYDEHDEKDHAQAMIDWLADKDPDVWFEVTSHLNWDSSFRVLDWIVSRPQCDKANAAMIFWGADPLYHLPRIGTSEHRRSEGFELIQRVLKNWKAGFYTRAQLAWDQDHRAAYARTLAGIWSKRDPLAIPPELLAPMKGRKPKVPATLRAENNEVLHKLLLGLGTWVETRTYRKQQRARVLAEQRAAILRDFAERVDFYWRASAWLALAAVVMIGGAFLARWINKGVLF
jgi:hypothetical protein